MVLSAFLSGSLSSLSLQSIRPTFSQKLLLENCIHITQPLLTPTKATMKAEAATTPVHIIEEDDDNASVAVASPACPVETVSVVSAPQHSANSCANSMEDAVLAFEEAMEASTRQARQVITAEAQRVNKRIQEFKDNSRSPPRSHKRQRCSQVLHQEEQAIFSQAVRSNRMLHLLQQMERIQAQLMDEMNACADDEELRGEEEEQPLDSCC